MAVRNGVVERRLTATCLICGKDITEKRAHAKWCSPKCAMAGFHMKNPGHRRGYMIKTTYGITVAEFTAMLDEQGGRCAVCRVVEVGIGPAKAQWNIDHCHRTGKVRGILCSPCNIGIGQFKDDPALLRAAADYLDFHQA